MRHCLMLETSGCFVFWEIKRNRKNMCSMGTEYSSLCNMWVKFFYLNRKGLHALETKSNSLRKNSYDINSIIWLRRVRVWMSWRQKIILFLTVLTYIHLNWKYLHAMNFSFFYTFGKNILYKETKRSFYSFYLFCNSDTKLFSFFSFNIIKLSDLFYFCILE